MDKMSQEQFENKKGIVLNALGRDDVKQLLDVVMEIVLFEDTDRVMQVNGYKNDERVYNRDDMSRYLYLMMMNLKSREYVNGRLEKYEKFRVVKRDNPQGAGGA